MEWYWVLGLYATVALLVFIWAARDIYSDSRASEWEAFGNGAFIGSCWIIFLPAFLLFWCIEEGDAVLRKTIFRGVKR